MNPFLWILFVCVGLGGSTLYAQGVGASVFSEGHTRLSVAGGYGTWNDHDYGIAGLGAGYYLMHGFEVGLDGEAWFGNAPHLYALSPGVRYTFYQMDSYKPYIGGFYRRSMYDRFSPLDSAGGRAGLVTSVSEHTYLSAGIVFEIYFHCDSSRYGTCSQTYPEIGFAFVY